MPGPASSLPDNLAQLAASPGIGTALERFRFSRKRGNALIFCSYAIPDGKPLHTFPGIALIVAPKKRFWPM
ncbi:hypothetical protein C1M53_12180 [Mesorhizobium sp. Pch-S]|nr:hypothetical protein C1M53_12180 [Mesorhizobium sp. Pch-S]